MSNTFTVQGPTWMSWFSPLHCVELQDISRSHLVARPTPTDTVWGSLKQSFPHQATSIQVSRSWVGIRTAGTSWKCVKSQVNVCWRESHIKDDHSFRLMGTNGKPHTHTHTYVRLRWKCVVHVWTLYIVYADKCLKYPTYSLKTAPLPPRLAKPTSLTHSACVYLSIFCLSAYNKQYVTCWASGSVHYLSLLPSPLHSGMSPYLVVGEQVSGLEQGK